MVHYRSLFDELLAPEEASNIEPINTADAKELPMSVLRKQEPFPTTDAARESSASCQARRD